MSRLAALLALLLAPAAQAACPYATLATPELRVAKIASPAPRSYFLLDQPGCPSDAPACRAKAFLVPGDVVLLTATQTGYACASYTGLRGAGTVGWLPAAALAPLPADSTTLADWVGRRKSVEQDITIFRGADGQLGIAGDATFGALDPQRVARGAVNMGSVHGTARPAKGMLAFTETDDGTLPYDQGAPRDCRLRLRIAGPYLLAEDNNNCGGMNVSFSGMYRRTN